MIALRTVVRLSSGFGPTLSLGLRNLVLLGRRRLDQLVRHRVVDRCGVEWQVSGAGEARVGGDDCG
jgi:hypothetical protein